MGIKIDEAALSKEIEESAASAMSQALRSWHVKARITEIVTTEIVDEIVSDASRKAVASIDRTELMNALAAELERATTRVFVNILSEGFVELIVAAPDLMESLREARDTIDASPGSPNGAALCDRIDSIAPSFF